MSLAPPTASKLSHLSTTILTSVLELERLHQLDLAPSPALTTNITKNLAHLSSGIDHLDHTSDKDDQVLQGLKEQEERIIHLVSALGVQLPPSTSTSTRRSKTGKLVDAGDDAQEPVVDPFESGDDVDVKKSQHVAIPIGPSRSELDVMEQDEQAMARANSQVMQMQRRMIEDQDDQLDSLSSAISRQHALSLRVAEELELHSNLLDDTEAAVDRTDANLRRQSGRLDRFAHSAKTAGSTGLIVALIIVLAILIVVFKL